MSVLHAPLGARLRWHMRGAPFRAAVGTGALALAASLAWQPAATMLASLDPGPAGIPVTSPTVRPTPTDSAQPSTAPPVTATPTPAPTETVTVTPTPTKEAPPPLAKPNCRGNPKLPKAVDERVCGKMPKGAINMTGQHGFATPSKNIWCDNRVFGGGPFECYIEEHDYWGVEEDWSDWAVNLPFDGGAASDGLWSTEPPEAYWELQEGRLPILEYGTVARIDTIACASAKTGLTCWNTETRHGFFLSRAAYKVW